MQGLRIKSESFLETVTALGTEAAGLYWTMELAGGPFITAGQPQSVVAALQSFAVVDTEPVWRPGVFPQFAHLVLLDEWGYFVGLKGPEHVALRNAVAISRMTWPSELFVEPAAGSVELVIIELEPGEWEVYSPHQDWLDRVSGHFPSERIDSKAGEWEA